MPNKRDSFNLRMPPNLRNRLEALAAEKELTLTALILELLRQQLDNLGK
jgi:predicted HicB family RNase H-like nuclease